MATTLEQERFDGRTHIVLVPGFVGFDALGQLEYYAGLTDLFDTWRRSGPAGRGVALHYFDNFPTASVEQRAKRLLRFLAKKVVRGEFGEHDRVALVGHSTGGLDIRKVLYELGRDPDGAARSDGACQTAHAKILGRIKRLCFLSVPHYGTNIGDFASRLGETAQSLLRSASLGVALNREPVATWRRKLTENLPIHASILLAIGDALNESDEHVDDSDAPTSDEREARSEFALWLEHMSKDFQILADLRSAQGGEEASETPAHFNAAQRKAELAAWRAAGISTRSYATYAPGSAQRKSALIEPLVRALRAGAPLLNAGSEALTRSSRLWMLPGLSVPALLTQLAAPGLPSLGVLGLINKYPALLFEVFCALCAEGPFRHPDNLWPQAIAPTLRDFVSGEEIRNSALAIGESDGVVNTLSMLWPHEPERPDAHPLFLVRADHGEIIGHYAARPLPDAEPTGRKYYAYDFFQSGTPFDGDCFHKVWIDIFEFCAS